VTCSMDIFIKIWDSQNEWKNTKTFPGHEHSVLSVRFMPGDQFAVSASRDRSIRIFDVASMHLIRTTISGHSDWVHCGLPSDDGRLLASASNDHTARIWDPLTGESKMELRGHDNVVEVVAFVPLTAYTAIRKLGGIPVRIAATAIIPHRTLLLYHAIHHTVSYNRHTSYSKNHASSHIFFGYHDPSPMPPPPPFFRLRSHLIFLFWLPHFCIVQRIPRIDYDIIIKLYV
ncbi:WD40-repeat-containing domain protein, partial [Mycena rosella]